MNYADRTAFSSVLVPLQAELHLSDVKIGLISSLFLWSYALMSPFSGIFADRYSRTLLVVASLVVWSACMGLTGFAHGFVLLCICRFGLGLGESPFHPAAFALVADHQPPALRARAMSLLSIGFRVGIVAGGSLSGLIAQHFGWRAGFWILGGGGMILALFARRYVTDVPQPAVAARPSAGAAIAYVLRDPSYLLILAKQILAEASTWIFLAWLPLYLVEDFHLQLGAAGILGSSMQAVSFAGGIAVGGWLSDTLARRGERYRIMAYGAAYLISAPVLLLFLAHPSLTLVTVAVALTFFIRGMGDANERPGTAEVVPRAYRATAYGLLNTCATASGGLGVLLAGVLKEHFRLNTVFAGSSVLYVIVGSALVIGSFTCVPRDIARSRAMDGPEPAAPSLPTAS